MMKKQLLFLTCMAVLFGCAKENLPQRPDAAIAVGQAKSRFLTLDSIQQLAAELPECFGEGALTRSGYTKSVADLFPLNDILRSSATKSGETDDAEVTKNIYVVNYADDGGFAILAADTLMETILAYSDQGNITDTMDNPGVRMFMEMIPGYAAAQLAHDPGWDSMSMEDKYPAQSEILLRREYTQVGPFVPVRWNQTEPFNEGINWPDMFTCNNTSNGKPVAGCVAIAMLNIMAANSYPTSFQVSNGWYTCYWDNWRSYLYGSWFPADSYDRRAIAALVAEIGSAVDMSYGCSSSSSSTSKADKAFKNRFNYLTDGIYSFNADRVRMELYYKRAIYVGGYATENWIGYSHGHDWVIDGYKDVYRVWGVYNNFYDENYNLIRQEPAGERKEQETRWLHCNYGWGGTGNGYYYVGVFNTEFPVELDPNCAKPSNYYYRFKLEIIKNIRPNI